MIDRVCGGEFRLHDHWLAARRGYENVRPLACPRAWHSLLNHVGPFGVDSVVVPAWVSSSQRTSQRTVRLRLRVARAAHIDIALASEGRPLKRIKSL